MLDTRPSGPLRRVLAPTILLAGSVSAQAANTIRQGLRRFQRLAGMVWALENPAAGIVEADEMDFRRCLEIQRPYLGPVKGYYTEWTPLTDRPGLFPEDIDTSDPWQFRNVLVR